MLGMLWLDKSTYKEPSTEFQIGLGMGPDLMTDNRGSDNIGLSELTEKLLGESEWSAGPSVTLKVTVGCTAEDVFGSREAYLAYFDLNEEGAQTVDDAPAASVEK